MGFCTKSENSDLYGGCLRQFDEDRTAMYQLKRMKPIVLTDRQN